MTQSTVERQKVKNPSQQPNAATTESGPDPDRQPAF